MPTIERLSRNLQFSFYLKAASTLSHLFLLPFILHRVDASLYGVNALLISIVSYFYYLDFGFNTGLSRYTAKFSGENKEEDLVNLFNLGIRIFFVIAIVAIVSLIGIAPFFPHIFDIHGDLAQDSRRLIYVYAASSFFLLLGVVFKCVLNGIQREDVIHKIDLVLVLVNIPLAIFILTRFRSYLIYITVFQGFTILASGAAIYTVFRILPFLKIHFRSIPKAFYRDIMSFSGYYFLAGICGLIIFQIDNFVIGAFLSVSTITAYSIAFVIHQQIRSLNGMLANPIYYILTSRFATHSKEDVDGIIMDTARMHIGILIPILVIVFVNTDMFIIAWVGEAFTHAITPARILISYFFVNIVTAVLTEAVVGGQGKVKEILRINGFVAFCNLVLSLALVKPMGLNGVALGTAAPWIVAGVFYLKLFCNHLAIPLAEFYKKAIRPNLPHIGVSVALAIVIRGIMNAPGLFEVLGCMGLAYMLTMGFAFILLEADKKSLVLEIIRIRL
ncbi:MAG: MATE family efflux transporter [Pseudomonadota bacterium]